MARTTTLDAEFDAFLSAVRPPASGHEIWRNAAFCAALVDRGWAATAWPEHAGGAGFSPVEELAWQRACHRNLDDYVPHVGVRLIGPLLAELGTRADRARWFPEILSLASRWCLAVDDAPGAPCAVQDDRLSGRKIGVAPADAELCLFDALGADGTPRAWVVETGTPGVTFHRYTSLAGDPLADLVFDDLPIAVLTALSPLTAPLASRFSMPDFGGASGRLGRALAELRTLADVAVGDTGDLLELEIALSALEGLESRYAAGLQADRPAFSPAVPALAAERLSLKIANRALDLGGYEQISADAGAFSHNELGGATRLAGLGAVRLADALTETTVIGDLFQRLIHPARSAVGDDQKPLEWRV